MGCSVDESCLRNANSSKSLSDDLLSIAAYRVFVLVWEFNRLKERDFFFFRALALLTISGFLALGFNATPLLATAEYAEFSTRGKSELQLNADGSPKEQSTGLTTTTLQSTVTAFESLNLIVPRIQGGGIK